MQSNVSTAGSPVPAIPTGANLPPGPVYNPPPLTDTTNPAPASTPSPTASFNATSVIQGESYTATHGAQRVTNGVGQFDNGDWIEYKAVNFGSGVSTFQA